MKGMVTYLFFTIIFSSCVSQLNDRLTEDSSFGGGIVGVETEIFEGGYGIAGVETPISFIFINSSSKTLSFNSSRDADRIIDELDLRFEDNRGHEHLKFINISVEEVYDDEFYNASCDDIGNVLEKYGKTNSLTIVLNNHLEDSCNGSAFLWTDISDKRSGLLIEYNSQIDEIGDVFAHELGHNIGLHHSARTYFESVPVIGLHNFNTLLGSGGISSKRCSSFNYFIDSQADSSSTIFEGVNYNSYANIMYPSYGTDDVERSFFTNGYGFSASMAIDCWYN